MLNRYMGDKAFYKKVLLIAIPIIIQNGITQFVSLLDNIMVGAVGQLPMSGVAIANQLLFVFNLCIFGASSGAGIFTAQFHGSGDHGGVRYTFRFKLLVCLALTVLGCGILLLGGQGLIGLFLQGDGDPREAALTLGYGLDYMRIMLLGLLPFAIANAYSSTLRECGQTMVPMTAGIAAVLTNLVLNWVLIFGHLGFRPMGVRGAAVATVVSRYVELGVVAVWTHTHRKAHPFIRTAYRSFRIPKQLLGRIAQKGLPLLANEFFWASGMAFLSQCYSTCGLAVVPASNIADVIKNLSSVVYMAMGNSVGILMGQLMGSGAGEQEVRSTNRRLMALAVAAGGAFAVLLAMAAPFFPRLYNVSEAVRQLSTRLIWVYAVFMAFDAYALSTYFTLRSGGQTLVTFLFDSCFVCVVVAPVAFCLSRFTDMGIIPLYAICHGANVLKAALGAAMLRRGKWIRNLTQ